MNKRVIQGSIIIRPPASFFKKSAGADVKNGITNGFMCLNFYQA